MTTKRRYDELGVGRYIMHEAMIRVILSNHIEGGEANFDWGKDAYITIKIGNAANWANVVKTAVHEVLEVSFRLGKASFAPSFNALSRFDTGRFRFFCDHDQFTEITDHAGDMLCYLLPTLKKAWPKMKKRKD